MNEELPDDLDLRVTIAPWLLQDRLRSLAVLIEATRDREALETVVREMTGAGVDPATIETVRARTVQDLEATSLLGGYWTFVDREVRSVLDMLLAQRCAVVTVGPGGLDETSHPLLRGLDAEDLLALSRGYRPRGGAVHKTSAGSPEWQEAVESKRRADQLRDRAVPGDDLIGEQGKGVEGC